MATVIFDLETDGLLDKVSKVHLLVLRTVETGTVAVFRNSPTEQSVEGGLALLSLFSHGGHQIVGHNVIGYDIPVIRKLYPGISINEAAVLDTLVYARLQWPDIKQQDLPRVKKGKFPAHLAGRHSLEAWGHRLGNRKGEYQGDTKIADEKERKARKWESWNQDMEDYCIQDTEVTHSLLALCRKHHHSDLSCEIEHKVAWIIARQERHGFAFDQWAAAHLYAKLSARREELTKELAAVFPPFTLNAGQFTPKRDNKKLGYVKGVPVTKFKQVEFNPASRDHVANRLMTLYGWEPEAYGKDGKPTVDDTVLASLDLPGAGVELLREYFMVEKRIGQVGEGKEAWLRHVQEDGRIHGTVNTNGAVTGRMTHARPNMAQVPSGHAPYGGECRALFTVPPGKILVGADADALELRDLAGYMARYDEGAYIETVLRGDKAQGTDMHSVNCRALGMEPKARVFAHLDPDAKETGRDVAKTWFYAFIYGAGDAKLGFILTRKKTTEVIQAGRASRDRFLKNLPALGALVARVKETAKKRGYLLGLDGRRLSVRAQHAALNTLLQSAGAVQMKMALCILDEELQRRDYCPGIHYEFVANVHDEWQIECDEDKGDEIGRLATESIRAAGERLGFRCPLAGAYAVGRTWADTH